MNLVLLSGGNPYDGSSGLVYDMYKSFKDKGHSVVLITNYYDIKFEPGIKSVYGKYASIMHIWSTKIRNKLARKTNPNYYMISLHENHNYIRTKKVLNHINFKVDAFLYLFPHHFLNSRNLYELNQDTGAPIFVMPMDMANFTGGCHYANNCEGYKHSCGICPGIYSQKQKDITYKNIIYKKKYISKTNVYTLGNQWSSEHIKQSSIYKDKPNFNLNILINESIFKPGDNNEARKIFNIPIYKKIILFAAASVREKRKGLSYLMDSLNILHKEISKAEGEKIGIAIAGNIETEILQSIPFDTYLLGYLNSKTELPLAYQMADVFVSPSIQDAGPMMVVQSMMCGTPVIAFEMGNAFDYIIDGETGYKVPLYDTIILKEKIISLLQLPKEEKHKMSIKCREIGLSKSSSDMFEKKFISIFKTTKNNPNQN
ncbi:MAG: glycosyltransferase [Bacteroidota bacterium]|nr:glycosyltransferase [Bacteroidota bacterium]